MGREGKRAVADMGRIQVDGALPVDLAIEKMADMGLLALSDHQSSEPHTHKEILNRCHEAMQASGPVPSMAASPWTSPSAGGSAQARSSGGIVWRSGSLPRRCILRVKLRSSSRRASSNTFSRRKRPKGFAPSCNTRARVRTAALSRKANVVFRPSAPAMADATKTQKGKARAFPSRVLRLDSVKYCEESDRRLAELSKGGSSLPR